MSAGKRRAVKRGRVNNACAPGCSEPQCACAWRCDEWAPVSGPHSVPRLQATRIHVGDVKYSDSFAKDEARSGGGDRFRQIPQMESRICPITWGLCRLRSGLRSVQILTQRSSVNESDDILCVFGSKKQCCSVLWLSINTVMWCFRLRTGRHTSNKLLASLILTSHNTVNFLRLWPLF